ncbi:MAG: hypothetical protein NT166_14560 [Candidatus Aminicenantes bacterium]|nr:hypothetical protein [Candidatus Aminicenantes bacterium]
MPDSNDKKTGFGLSRFLRNHYFRGKLLTTRDFEAEQDYLNNKRHLLNRMTGGPGVICGLGIDDVEFSESDNNVKIRFKTGGAAIDGWGREIVVPIEDSPRDILVKQGSTPTGLTLADLENDPYYLYLEYNPQEGEMVNSASGNSSCGETCYPNRVIENFEVIADTVKPGAQTIACPDFTGETSGAAARKAVKKWLWDQTAGICKIPGESRIFFLALSKGSTIAVDPQKTAQYVASVTNNTVLSELLACHLADFDNPHKISAALLGALKSVDGVSNPGGNVDLVKDNSITITPDDANNTIKIGESHSARTDNPHQITAALLEALKSVDGVSDPGGNVDLVKANSITITPDIPGKKITIGETHSATSGNPHETKHADIKEVLPIFGDAVNDKRNKHISNNDAEKWNSAVEGVGLKSIDGVVNPGGNIDLIGKNSLTITPDMTAKTITIDENHSTNMENPHKTTAEQVEALSLKGGVVNGNVSINGNVLANGNVGVGTEVPDSTLSVVGERGVDFPLDGNQIAAGFYGSPGSNGRPIVVINRGNKGEDGMNYGPLISFLFHGKDVGRITVNENGALSYLPFTGSHLGWSNETLELNILVSMTGENKLSLEDLPTSEPLYGVVAAKIKNDRKVLGTVFSSEKGQILVAAVGNHFIWVADTGKDIEAGDALISSGVPGHAQKDPEEDKYSYVIGRAAQDVKWAEIKDYIEANVNGTKQKIKHTLISVLFGFYEKRNHF